MVGIVLNTNLSSLNAQRNLEINRSQLGGSITRIASGIRIEGAADGGAELTLSENIRADVLALQQGSRNLIDGQAFIKTAEGALNEISSILLRLRSLASQSANGTIGDTERVSTDLEYQASLRELDRIVATTEFNGTFLLNGTLAASQPVSAQNVLQLGVDSSSDNQINLNQIMDLTDVSASSLNLTDSNIRTQGGAFQALNDLTQSIDQLIQVRGRVGTTQIRMLRALSNLDVQAENLNAAVSTIRDADLAEEVTTLTKNQLLVQAGVAMVGQANLNPQAALTLLEGV